MADLLILNKDHWMDKLTAQEVADREKASPGFQAKYNRRNQKGDIIEVQEDGHYGDTQTGKGKFKILRMPGVKRVDAVHYGQKLKRLTGVSIEGEPQYETLRQSKYNIKLDNLETRLTAITKFEQPTATDVHKIEKIQDLSTDFVEKTEAAELAARS